MSSLGLRGRRPVSIACFGSCLIAVAEPLAGAQSTVRASLAADGSEITGWSTHSPQRSISDDGRFVVFCSAANGIVPADSNGLDDIFLRDLAAGTTLLVSRSSTGGASDGPSYDPTITPDGAYVAFTSYARNLTGTDQRDASDIFRWERATGAMVKVSRGWNGGEVGGDSRQPAISADGDRIAFLSYSRDLVPDDTNNKPDIFVREVSIATTRRVNLKSDGSQATNFNHVDWPAISRDGSTVAFITDGKLVSIDGGNDNIYAVDLATGLPEMIDVKLDGRNAMSCEDHPIRLSADGRHVAFAHAEDELVAGDVNGRRDIFLHDRVTRAVEILTLDDEGRQDPDPTDPVPGDLSVDLRFALFSAKAAHYLDGETGNALLIRDRLLGATIRAVRAADGSPGASGPFGWGSISGDGRFLAFDSGDDLVDGDGNGVYDVFVRERLFAPASWELYGAGAPGRHGVPGISLDAAPQFATDAALEIGNSAGLWTVATLLYGSERDALPLYGGELLLVPEFAVSFVVPPTGLSIVHPIPYDEPLVGAHFLVQALELDPWAIDGVSMTAAIDAVAGY